MKIKRFVALFLVFVLASPLSPAAALSRKKTPLRPLLPHLRKAKPQHPPLPEQKT